MNPLPRVAILGANGQVGAELCLLLARRSDLQIVPICRNRSGSAYLRWMGIPCRHGRPSDPNDAARLLGDCDIVINSALATGTPAEIRKTEEQLVRQAFTHSKAGAKIIHFSTQNVYGDPRVGRFIRWKSPYGRTKLTTEKRVRSEMRRTGKAAYIFRLGHVCGALQGMSFDVREEVRAARVILPERDCASNTVYTVTIIDAILQVMSRASSPGVYDLMNVPQWTWRQVYAYEAQELSLPFKPVIIASTAKPTWAQNVVRQMIRTAGALASNPFAHQHGSKIMAHLPDTLNRRVRAWWQRRRARSEIAALSQTIRPAEHLSWVINGRNAFPGLSSTAQLMQSRPYDALSRPPASSWPPDLPDADSVHPSQERLNSARIVADISS